MSDESGVAQIITKERSPETKAVWQKDKDLGYPDLYREYQASMGSVVRPYFKKNFNQKKINK